MGHVMSGSVMLKWVRVQNIQSEHNSFNKWVIFLNSNMTYKKLGQLEHDTVDMINFFLNAKLLKL